MNVLKSAFVPTVVAGLFAGTVQAADGGVRFFSRSGQDSHFAAGVHGYDKPAVRPHRDTTYAIRDMHFRVDRPSWHRVSHYEYYPPTIVRHGDHYDVHPGRYAYRSVGYWD